MSRTKIKPLKRRLNGHAVVQVIDNEAAKGKLFASIPWVLTDKISRSQDNRFFESYNEKLPLSNNEIDFRNAQHAGIFRFPTFFIVTGIRMHNDGDVRGETKRCMYHFRVGELSLWSYSVADLLYGVKFCSLDECYKHGFIIPSGQPFRLVSETPGHCIPEYLTAHLEGVLFREYP